MASPKLPPIGVSDAVAPTMDEEGMLGKKSDTLARPRGTFASAVCVEHTQAIFVGVCCFTRVHLHLENVL